MQPPELKYLTLKIDGLQLQCFVENDAEGEELLLEWKEYWDRRILPQMNPATLYQIVAYR